MNTPAISGLSPAWPVSFSTMLARISASSGDFSGRPGARASQAACRRRSINCIDWRSTSTSLAFLK